jgi:hypothetical protein
MRAFAGYLNTNLEVANCELLAFQLWNSRLPSVNCPAHLYNSRNTCHNRAKATRVRIKCILYQSERYATI